MKFVDEDNPGEVIASVAEIAALAAALLPLIKDLVYFLHRLLNHPQPHLMKETQTK